MSKRKQKQRGKIAQLTAPQQSRNRRLLWLTVPVIALALAGWFSRGLFIHESNRFASSSGASLTPRFEEFLGSEACAKCHQQEYDLWKDSTHGHAGGKPGEARIIARFDGNPLIFADAVVTPVATNNEYLFRIDSGGTTRDVKVFATVGGGHMMGGGTQSFFQKAPDGTARFLPFDYIRREGLWFVQLRRDRTWVPVSKEISFHTDLANWPPNRVLGTLTEFSNCQNCHGSQITVAYDKQTRRYDTHFQTLQINCESCHGPGRHHVEIVSKPGFEESGNVGMRALATLTKDESLNVCFQCHATKDVIREEPYLPGARLEDFFSLKLPLFQDTFTVDGRVKTFGYQSTHLYSGCYLNGSMTCVDCHEPHGQGYRDHLGKPLAGRFENGQCTSCHASKALASDPHSHHKADSPGNRCVGCHMPYLQHQGVGDHLMYARSDHGIPVPRPGFDQSIGIENACQKCHRDHDLAWQQARLTEWYGQLKPHHPAISNLMASVDTADPLTAARQLLMPNARHPMAEMAGLVQFAKRFLRPEMNSIQPELLEPLKAFIASGDLDLKAMGFAILHIGFGQQPETKSVLDSEIRKLGNDEHAVKDRWAVIADYVGGEFANRGEMQPAISCFRKSLEIKPDNVVTISHLALAHLRSGDQESAVAALQQGLRLRPEKAVLHFQLAQTYAQLQKFPDAIKELERGLEYAPEDQTALRMRDQLREQSH